MPRRTGRWTPNWPTRIAAIDDVAAERKAETLRAGSPSTSLDEETSTCSPRPRAAKTSSLLGPPSRCWRSSAARTWASPPSSTASSAAARPSSKTLRASPATGSATAPSGTTASSRSSTPAAGSRTPRASTPPSPLKPRSRSTSPIAVLFVVDAMVGPTATDERSGAAASLHEEAGHPGGEQDRRHRAGAAGRCPLEPRAG